MNLMVDIVVFKCLIQTQIRMIAARQHHARLKLAFVDMLQFKLLCAVRRSEHVIRIRALHAMAVAILRVRGARALRSEYVRALRAASTLEAVCLRANFRQKYMHVHGACAILQSYVRRHRGTSNYSRQVYGVGVLESAMSRSCARREYVKMVEMQRGEFDQNIGARERDQNNRGHNQNRNFQDRDCCKKFSDRDRDSTCDLVAREAASKEMLQAAPSACTESGQSTGSVGEDGVPVSVNGTSPLITSDAVCHAAADCFAACLSRKVAPHRLQEKRRFAAQLLQGACRRAIAYIDMWVNLWAVRILSGAWRGFAAKRYVRTLRQHMAARRLEKRLRDRNRSKEAPQQAARASCMTVYANTAVQSKRACFHEPISGVSTQRQQAPALQQSSAAKMPQIAMRSDSFGGCDIQQVPRTYRSPASSNPWQLREQPWTPCSSSPGSSSSSKRASGKASLLCPSGVLDGLQRVHGKKPRADDDCGERAEWQAAKDLVDTQLRRQMSMQQKRPVKPSAVHGDTEQATSINTSENGRKDNELIVRGQRHADDDVVGQRGQWAADSVDGGGEMVVGWCETRLEPGLPRCSDGTQAATDEPEKVSPRRKFIVACEDKGMAAPTGSGAHSNLDASQASGTFAAEWQDVSHVRRRISQLVAASTSSSPARENTLPPSACIPDARSSTNQSSAPLVFPRQLPQPPVSLHAARTEPCSQESATPMPLSPYPPPPVSDKVPPCVWLPLTQSRAATRSMRPKTAVSHSPLREHYEFDMWTHVLHDEHVKSRSDNRRPGAFQSDGRVPCLDRVDSRSREEAHTAHAHSSAFLAGTHIPTTCVDMVAEAVLPLGVEYALPSYSGAEARDHNATASTRSSRMHGERGVTTWRASGLSSWGVGHTLRRPTTAGDGKGHRNNLSTKRATSPRRVAPRR
jgi:hypothetical protein